MQLKIQMVITQQNQVITKDIINIDRQELSAETLGLTLNEAKLITSGIQKTMADCQIADYIYDQKFCSCCGKKSLIKGYHVLKYRTLFGKLCLKSPRFHVCNCQHYKNSSFSPLAKLLPERTAPELRYFESRWASLMSYGMTAKFLEEVFPLKAHYSSIEYNAHKVSERLEQELGKEQYMFIEGCQNEWEKLPMPDIPLTIAMDGGYIHAREGKDRKAGWFEAIVGKSLQEGKESKRFAFVVGYDTKQKRRLYEMLRKQGLQANQAITFISDGGDGVKDLQMYMSPNSGHILDWFHITMKITCMQQMVKGLVIRDKYFKPKKEIDRIKWYLWHGNVHKALSTIESFIDELEIIGCDQEENRGYKLWQAVNEFDTYIRRNSHCIINYGENYRYGEKISSGFAESTVNEIISKRMAKKQQMRWTKKGAHLLLQLRVKTLNNELRESFCQWYPKMKMEDELCIPLAA